MLHFFLANDTDDRIYEGKKEDLSHSCINGRNDHVQRMHSMSLSPASIGHTRTSIAFALILNHQLIRCVCANCFLFFIPIRSRRSRLRNETNTLTFNTFWYLHGFNFNHYLFLLLKQPKSFDLYVHQLFVCVSFSRLLYNPTKTRIPSAK